MAVSKLDELILYCIQVHGAFSYPSLGTFRLRRKPASYTIDRKQINPPETILEFGSEIDANFDILTIGKKIGISDQLLNTIFSPLDKFLSEPYADSAISLHLSGIGEITKSKDEIYFFITQDVTHFNTYHSWPSLPISPLSSIPEKIEHVIQIPKPLIFQKQRSSGQWTQFIFPLIVISIVSIFLLSRNIPVSLNSPDNKILHTADSNSLDNLVDTIFEKENFDTLNTATQNDATIDELSSQTDSKSDNDSILTSFESKENITANQTNHTCIYIIGAFTKTKNAQKLQKKLRKKGLIVEIYLHDNFQRVGVSLPCNQFDSPVFKTLLKSYPDIWLMEE
ncbi:MAG: hypothetical protein WAT79_05845 [Saprospiraceae bacterium]